MPQARMAAPSHAVMTGADNTPPTVSTVARANAQQCSTGATIDIPRRRWTQTQARDTITLIHTTNGSSGRWAKRREAGGDLRPSLPAHGTVTPYGDPLSNSAGNAMAARHVDFYDGTGPIIRLPHKLSFDGERQNVRRIQRSTSLSASQWMRPRSPAPPTSG